MMKHTVSMRSQSRGMATRWRMVCSLCGWEGDWEAGVDDARRAGTHHSDTAQPLEVKEPDQAETDEAGGAAEASYYTARRMAAVIGHAALRDAAMARLEAALRNLGDS